jgi:phosphate acetyltransferase
MPENSDKTPANLSVTQYLLDQLRNHPKRVVFTEGEDLRVIEAAARLVEEEVVAPILLGNREKIRAMAKEAGISMKFIHVIDPPTAGDFGLFCKRVENMARYRTMQIGEAEELVARPHYFGALMVQYGQADAVVGGNQAVPAAFYRALINTIKPLPHVPKLFGVMVLTGPHLQNMGGDGLLFLTDTALTPEPDVQQLATIAVETGKLATHMLGRPARVAMLSHSTKGSFSSDSARKMAAAAALARDLVVREFVDLQIDGEVQADVALDPAAAESKLAEVGTRQSADVLVFPNLDAAHISMKLLQHVAGANVFGHIIMGLARPAAQVPRTASINTIFGTAAAVAVEAIKYHHLYPQGEV